MQDIIDSVCAVLAAKYSNPPIPVEVTNRGEGFSRPSFFVEFVTEPQSDVNRTVYEGNPVIQITYFAAWDDYSNTDTPDQLVKYEEVKKLFSELISLPVGNRYLYIDSITASSRNNEVFFTLNLTRRTSRVQSAPAAPATTIEINLQGA